jgi:predicted Zn-ribbon and HTH transcriptional regulator
MMMANEELTFIGAAILLSQMLGSPDSEATPAQINRAIANAEKLREEISQRYKEINQRQDAESEQKIYAGVKAIADAQKSGHGEFGADKAEPPPSSRVTVSRKKNLPSKCPKCGNANLRGTSESKSCVCGWKSEG